MGLFSGLKKAVKKVAGVAAPIVGGIIGGPAGAAIGQGVAGVIGAGKASKAAKNAAQQATPVPYSVQGPAGGFFVDPVTQQIQLSQAANPFGQMFNAIGASSLANAAVAPGQALYGASPEVQQAFQGLFGQGLTDQIQSQLNLLRQAAAPEENRQRLGLDEQLFARGQLGTSGGAERFRALSEAQSQADLQRQLAAVGLGQQTAQDRFQGAIAGTGQGLQTQAQQFNIGQGAFQGLQGLFQNLIQQGNLGLGAASGTPSDIARYAAEQSQAPYQSAYNFLNTSGAFDALGNIFGRRPEIQPVTVTAQRI